ncbi:coniferyl aldehyde dehydrogenase [Pseudomonas sp. R5(2019)]|uniref:coniferyl aldehyde dehydrogenase n=1 Tax=Pseudomonas sp. R5(2019) TaxID=2697566 RepID=UPI001412A85F|nr:coniferyl aldehyde dehydrogenase [Pseudomonas sp. R5(2019)]NBA97309.1 aldehyde dehydrogenase family protein [Pseudomonas sp. R5(2019)]
MNARLQSVAQLETVLAAQRVATDHQGLVSLEVRQRRLQAAIDLLVDYSQPLAEAMDRDFGGRHPGFGLMQDVLGSLTSLKYARDHLAEWLPDSPRQPFAPYDQLGAKAWVRYQPKGSIGILGTWNAPLFTLFSPLASAFAAGNRAVLKPSEVSSHTAEVLAAAIAERFDPLELAVITGGADVAQGFASQAFDHLVFTGSTAVGKVIMRCAAEHLVPVTLELGGKSPAILGSSLDMAEAARRLAIAKGTNGGQICISPDLLYVPQDQQQAFIAAFSAAWSELWPNAEGNPDLVSVINDRHLQRIDALLDDAAEQGARIIHCPAEAPQRHSRKRPLSLVIDPPAQSRIMQEEIFGPALVLLSYRDIEQVVAHINAGERPLALYYFGDDLQEQAYVLDHTLSGGVTLNDALMHAAMEDAPFGGVGASGMGHYHGREGFIEFSHARTVFQSPAHDPRREWGVLPPYGEHFVAAMQSQVSR